jgi:hypothetical protein
LDPPAPDPAAAGSGLDDDDGGRPAGATDDVGLVDDEGPGVEAVVGAGVAIGVAIEGTGSVGVGTGRVGLGTGRVGLGTGSVGTGTGSVGTGTGSVGSGTVGTGFGVGVGVGAGVGAGVGVRVGAGVGAGPVTWIETVATDDETRPSETW